MTMRKGSGPTSLEERKTQLVINETGFFFARDGWVFDVRYAAALTQDEAERVIGELQASDAQIGLKIGYKITSCAAVLQERVAGQGSYVIGIPQRQGHPKLLDEDGEWQVIRNLTLDLAGVARFLNAAAAEGATLAFENFSSMKTYQIVGPIGSQHLVEV